MILNSKFNNFIINFPVDWLFPEVLERYNIFLKRFPVPYTSLIGFLNTTIQSITFPSFQPETVQQHTRNFKANWRGGYDLQLYKGEEFTINFKTTEGYVNYWIMQEQLNQYYSYENQKEFLKPLRLMLLDQRGYLISTFIYHFVIMDGISPLDLSFTSINPEFRTFSCNFKFSSIELKTELE